MTICGFRVIDTMGGEIMNGAEIIPATKPLEAQIQKIPIRKTRNPAMRPRWLILKNSL